MQQHSYAQPDAHAPTATPVLWHLVRMIVVDHVQSQRIFVEWGSAVAVALLVLRDSVSASAVMSVWALYAIVLSLYVTSVLADSAEHPLNVQRLLAVQSRRLFLYAYVIAANLIIYSCTIVLVLTSLVVAPLARPALLVIAASLPSMVLLIAVASAIMLLLTPLVSSTLQRIAVLIVVAIPIAWDNIASYFFPTTNTAAPTPIPDALNTVFGILLWPSLHLFDTVVTPRFTQATFISYAIHLVVLAGIVWMAQAWFTRKHITNI